jgi:hypothetical protein
VSHLESTSEGSSRQASARVARSTLRPEPRVTWEDDAGDRVPDSIASLYSTISNEAFWDVDSVGAILKEELLALGS